MHEFSIMVEIVEAALKSIENYEVENVENVYLDVGELTFLNPEQLQFAFKVLTQDNALNGADLVIEGQKAKVECLSCGYNGELMNEAEGDHFGFLRVFCPKCSGRVSILSGRECVLRRIQMNLKENDGGQDK